MVSGGKRRKPRRAVPYDIEVETIERSILREIERRPTSPFVLVPSPFPRPPAPAPVPEPQRRVRVVTLSRTSRKDPRGFLREETLQ